MGFWSSVGGVISTVYSWAKDAAAPIASVIKNVGTWMKDVGQITEAHLEGRSVVMEDESPTRRATGKRVNNEDFVWDAEDQLTEERKTLFIKIEEQNSKITSISKKNQENQAQIKLQLEVVELIIESQTIGRFAANIQLHEANLRIHHQGIQNSVGMLDAINRQRVGLKALFSQVNKVILSLNVAGLNKHDASLIEGINVDPRPGAISISNAYNAFDETVCLLHDEAQEFIDLTDRQIKKALHVRAVAANVPGKQHRIENWIDTKVIPSLKRAKKSTNNLLLSLDEIPKIRSKEQLHSIAERQGDVDGLDD